MARGARAVYAVPELDGRCGPRERIVGLSFEAGDFGAQNFTFQGFPVRDHYWNDTKSCNSALPILV